MLNFLCRSIICLMGFDIVSGLTAGAEAHSIRLIHSFAGGGDGAVPYAGLIQDKQGNLFGTTDRGGSDNYGVVFQITSAGDEHVVYSFTAEDDGQQPDGGLSLDKSGNLFGTTAFGGPDGNGNVFKVTPDGNETSLYAFTGGDDGSLPYDKPTLGADGNIYGTTQLGGPYDEGVVFKLASDGTETVAYAFTGGSDGSEPVPGVVIDKQGNIYGTTVVGGTNLGVVFKISPRGKETVLHSFSGGSDGAMPYGDLLLGKDGTIYGTTMHGGSANRGVVFEITHNGGEKILYTFQGGSDGSGPYAGLIMDKNGTLYGTTTTGGTGANGFGTVFELSRKGKEKILYAFSGGADGAYPYGKLIQDKKGNLYGTTSGGGDHNSGTVFEIKS